MSALGFEPPALAVKCTLNLNTTFFWVGAYKYYIKLLLIHQWDTVYNVKRTLFALALPSNKFLTSSMLPAKLARDSGHSIEDLSEVWNFRNTAFTFKVGH